MHRFRALPRFRVVLIVVAALALAVVLSLSFGAQTAEAEWCGDGFYQWFYSDASHSTQVGHRIRDCTGWTRTYGQVTQWSTVNFFPCCTGGGVD